MTPTPQPPNGQTSEIAGSLLSFLGAAVWPAVVVVALIVLGGPARRLITSLAVRIESAHDGEVKVGQWLGLSWSTRVVRAITPLEAVEPIRPAGDAKIALNQVRHPASTPADVVIEAHEAVTKVVKSLAGAAAITAEGDWLAPLADRLLAGGKITRQLTDALYVLDDLYSIALATGKKVDGRNAEEYIRLAESVLTRLPPPDE